MTELLTTPPQDEHVTDNDNLAATVKIMDRLHASEIFSTPEDSKAFLDSLTYEEFKKYLGTVNGIERGIPTSERGKVSSSFVQTDMGLLGSRVEYRPPHQSFRDDLLKAAFEKAQSIDDPELAGLTLGLSINAIHYFDDGNGRTARMAYALLSKGYDDTPESQAYYSALLENTKGRNVINPNPAESGIDKKIRSELFMKVREQFGYDVAFGDKPPTYVFDGYPDGFAGEESPDELAVSDEIDAQGRAVLHHTLQSRGMPILSLMASFPPDRVKDFVTHTKDGRTFVNGNTFLPTLSKDEVTRWWNTTEHMTRSYVLRLIKVADRKDVDEIAASYRDTQAP